MTKAVRNIVVFDLGGVLIDWDPRYLYRKLFRGDETAIEHLLSTVCTREWNLAQDAGRSFAEGARLLKRQHPDKAELIDAYGARFDEMMAGPIAGTVEILAELRDRGAPLYSLTNWSAEPIARRSSVLNFSVGSAEFSCLARSARLSRTRGFTRSCSPASPSIRSAPSNIDDHAANAEAARRFGIHGIHFMTSDALRRELVRLALLCDH